MILAVALAWVSEWWCLSDGGAQPGGGGGGLWPQFVPASAGALAAHAMMLAAPSTVQCMPDCLARRATICLHAASMAPDPVNMPSALNRA